MAEKNKNPKEVAADQWPYTKKNYIAFGAAIAVILIGFFMLSQGSITFSVLFLVAGFCVLIPYALLAKDKTKADVESPQ